MNDDKAYRLLFETYEKNFSFTLLCQICEHYFGELKVKGSHHIFKTGLQEGESRINIQPGKGDNSKAKDYQVYQVRKAVECILSRRKKDVK
jgi:hypothetical protein